MLYVGLDVKVVLEMGIIAQPVLQIEFKRLNVLVRWGNLMIISIHRVKYVVSGVSPVMEHLRTVLNALRIGLVFRIAIYVLRRNSMMGLIPVAPNALIDANNAAV